MTLAAVSVVLVPSAEPVAISCSLVLAGGFLVCGLFSGRLPVATRLIGSAQLVAFVATHALSASAAPAVVLTLAVAATLSLSALWPSRRLWQLDAPSVLSTELATGAVAAFVALSVGLAVGTRTMIGWPIQGPALAFMYVVPVVSVLASGRELQRRADRDRSGEPASRGASVYFEARLLRGAVYSLYGALLFALAPLALAFTAAQQTGSVFASLGLIAPLVAGSLAVAFRASRGGANLRRQIRPVVADAGMLSLILQNPARVLVLSFALICALGAVLLASPFSAQDGAEIGALDALFTAVSATCVTGLAVVDTPGSYSFFGELVILALIQLGGLGVMVFSATLLRILGRRLSMAHERAAADIVGAAGRADLLKSVRIVFLVTFATEAAVAVCLFVAFLADGAPIATSAWRAIFTAVSAFCNAGFALQSDSLVQWAGHPVVLSVVAVAIILGGLGPVVVAEVVSSRPKGARYSLHFRVVIGATAALITLPAVLITFIEWHGSLAGLSPVDRISNAIFQSITLRTAGFNSIDLGALHPATWSAMLITMFVGGSPGSTAGGVKTTTLAVAVVSIVAVIRGRDRVEVAGRTLPTALVVRSGAILAIGVAACFAALIALQLTQSIPLEHAAFEVVSALATVGLSTGGTAMLDEVGKVIIIACMFAGRVGPLSLFAIFVSRGSNHRRRGFPDETIPIG